jgi:hypothetical protein
MNQNQIKAVIFMLVSNLAVFASTFGARTAYGATETGTAAQTMDSINASSLQLIPSLGITSLSGASNDSMSAGSGMQVGVLADLKLGGKLFLETGALYLESKQVAGLEGLASASETRGYLAVPVLAKYHFMEVADTAVLFGKAGITPAFLASAKQQTEIFGEGQSVDVKGERSSMDFLVTAGLGGTMQVAPRWSVVADLSFVRGMKSVVREGDAVHQQGLIVNLGASFAL